MLKISANVGMKNSVYVFKLLELDKNIWKHINVYKLFSLRTVTWRHISLQMIHYLFETIQLLA